LRRSRFTLLALLIVGASARADLPEFDEATFDRGLFHTNLFNWVDFDGYDTSISFPALSPDDTPNGITPYVEERWVYDNNVYRLPSHGPSPLTIPVASRSDDINTVTAGLDAHVGDSGQVLEVLARADRNDFFRNSDLDNTSSAVRVLGDWQVGSSLTGQVGASYDKQLNDFANYEVYTKDLVTTDAAFASAHLDLGSMLFDASARGAEISHSSDDVKYRNNIERASAAYRTPGGTFVSVIYQYTNGRFPLPQFIEHSVVLQIDSPLGNTFRVRAGAGYLTHDYSQVPAATPDYNFSGGIWNAQLAWEPRDSVQVLLTGDREVHAYLDAESQYFVSEVARIVGRWAPTPKLICELEYSRENQHFIGPGPPEISLTLPEHNILHTAQFNLAYSIFRPLQVVLSYRYINRDSNAPVLAFDDDFVSVSVRARF
jgi:hypothetical protein